MALVKTWYETEKASDKFGIPAETILEWVEEGLVRCEREGDNVVRVNIDDVKLEMEGYLRGED
jgi:predicted site-specific integrase-resolvase